MHIERHAPAVSINNEFQGRTPNHDSFSNVTHRFCLTNQRLGETVARNDGETMPEPTERIPLPDRVKKGGRLIAVQE